MAKKLSEEDRRRIATDFDPPNRENSHPSSALKRGKRLRVTAALSPEEYAAIRAFAEKNGVSMSRAVAEAVSFFCKSFR